MDPRLADHFERELRHVREMRREFADRFPKAAGRLSIDGLACDDPYVERLTEAYAFLAARVQMELELSFPAFTQAMLETLCPACLGPVPSAAIVRLQADDSDSGVAGGYLMPRGRLLRSPAPRGQTACSWRTAHDVTLWPVRLVSATYHTSRELGALRLPEGLRVPDIDARRRPARAAVRLVIESVGPPLAEIAAAGLDRLPLFLPGEDDAAGPQRLWEHLLRHGGPMLVRQAGTDKAGRVVEQAVRRYGFAPEQAMIPPGPRLAEAHRLVLEYLTLPERFRFIELVGLRNAIRAGLTPEATSAELVLPLWDEEPQLEGVVSAEDFLPYCTPIVNLFPRETDRKNLTERSAEHHLCVDRTRPLDYEIWRVDRVEGFTGGSAQRRQYTPMYQPIDPLLIDGPEDAGQGGGSAAHFTWRRVPRPASDLERRDGSVRSRYAGTEVYVTLSAQRPGDEALRQLGAAVWCTNRDLPLGVGLGRGDDDLVPLQGEPITSIRGVSGSPTSPKLGPAWATIAPADGDSGAAASPATWQLVNVLGQNHVPLAGGDSARPAAALRSLLTVLGGGDAVARAAAGAIRSTQAQPVVRRVRSGDSLGFARGLSVELELDDEAGPPGGPLLLASVLEQVFVRSVSINSFVETRVRTQQRGRLHRWRPQLGRRNLL